MTRYYLKETGAGEWYRRLVADIVKVNWFFANHIGHRQESTTETDARPAVIYTYMTLGLVDGLTQKRVAD